MALAILLFVVLSSTIDPSSLYAYQDSNSAHEFYISDGEISEERFSMVFRGEKLSDALSEFVRVTGIDLVYDPQLIDDDGVFVRLRNLTAREGLSKLLDGTGLDFITLSSGTIVLVKNARLAPLSGTLSGRVVDSRTGRPLPGASIYLSDASGGTASNQSGFFSLPNVLSGNHELIVSYVGYNAIKIPVRVPAGGELRKEITLEQKPFLIEPIVVTDHNRRLGFQNGTVESVGLFNDIGFQPGTDPVKALGLFSGVQFQLPFADLNIQGSTSNDHRFYLDGAPVYHPFSFGHMFSAFSPFAIDRITVHKAGFDARAGSQISGLVNLSHDISNRSANRATIQADPVSTNIRADAVTRIGSGKLETMFAIRNNLWGFYEDPVLSSVLRQWDYIDPIITNLLMDANTSFAVYDEVLHEADVRFSDIHLGSRYQINPFQSISYSLYTGYNRIGTQLLNRIQDPDPHYAEFMFARDSYVWNNLVTSLRYDGMLTARTDLGIQISYSANTLEHTYRMAGSTDAGLPDGIAATEAYQAFTHNQLTGAHRSEENFIQHGIISADITHSLSRQLRFSGGVQLDFVETRVDLSDLFYIPTLSATNTVMGSTFGGMDWHPSPAWHLSLSSRLTYVEQTDKFYVEPRFAVQYDRASSPIGYWSVHLAGGLYRQFINQFSVTNVGPSSLVPSVPIWTHAGELTVPKAWHITPSFMVQPTEGTSVRIEAFGKWHPVSHHISYPKLLLSESTHINNLTDFTEQTRSFQYGGGISIAQKIPILHTEIIAGYDFTRSEIYMGEQFGRWIPAPWSEPHRSRLMFQSRISSKLSINGRWSGSYGRTWGYRQAYYDFMIIHNRHQYGSHRLDTPETDRLPNFHQLDIGIQYDQRLGGGTVRARLDLINVLNRRNVLDYGLMPGDSEGDFVRRSRTIPGFNPTVSAQISF